jgi:hypothetical protein
VYSEIFYVLSNEGEEEEEDEQSNINITLEDLQKCALDSESQAAKKFGCGTTRFKTICRKLGIARWPHRKLHSLLEMYKSLAGYYQVGNPLSIDFNFFRPP